MPFLSATHTTLVTTTLPPTASLPQVLSLLHDHGAMLSLNPLVISHRLLRPSITRSRSSSTSTNTSSSSSNSFHLDDKPLPPPPTYEVVDSLDTSISIPDDNIDNEKCGAGEASWTARMTAKLSPSTVTYTAQMTNVPHGLETVINAPMGIRSFNTWSVRHAGGSLVLEERSQMSANRFVIGFASKTAQESHEKLVRRFVSRLEETDQGDFEGLEK